MFYNSHIHTFMDIDVPRKFLPLSLVRILATKAGTAVIAKVLNMINPFTDNDLFNRYVNFFKAGKLGSQEEIFKQCQKFYPRDSRFVILPMDMAYMRAGEVPRQYNDQLNELAGLARKIPEIIPFMHIDPRRPGVLDLLKENVEENGFKGIKLYPPLGYFPYDKYLYPVYEYCQAHNLPVISHCSPINLVHYRGSRKEVAALLSKSLKPIDIQGKSKKELFACFAHPSNYEPLLQDFPDLRICVAHFGSGHYWDKFLSDPEDEDNWFSIIKGMIEKYKNFYTDISFTLNNREYFSLLKVLMYDDKINRKILFGSDYYMVETKADERRFGIDLRAFLGNEYFKLISVENPKRFLGV